MFRVDPAASQLALDLAPRYPAHRRGHVESWFLRLNSPDARRALWVRHTVLRKDGGRGGPPQEVAEPWCAWFDAESGRRPFAAKATLPMTDASFTPDGDDLRIRIGGLSTDLGTRGHTRGALSAADGVSTAWDLRFVAAEGPLGAPLCAYPTRRMIEARLPKTKTLTPLPVLTFDGHVEHAGQRFDVRGWHGSLGHNWGEFHPYTYAWTQIVFPGADGRPLGMVEGFTGRIKLGGLVTPAMSSLIVRRGDQEYRFDAAFSLWRQKARVADNDWTLRVSGPAGDAMLSIEADPAQVVALNYPNPDGSIATCLNSKLAHALVRVNPVNGEGFELRTAHGAALEMLRPTPHPDFPASV